MCIKFQTETAFTVTNAPISIQHVAFLLTFLNLIKNHETKSKTQKHYFLPSLISLHHFQLHDYSLSILSVLNFF